MFNATFIQEYGSNIVAVNLIGRENICPVWVGLVEILLSVIWNFTYLTNKIFLSH
jgi:hypothetical protein